MSCRLVTLLWLFLAANASVHAENTTPAIPLDGGDWKLAPDPKNVGVAEKWWKEPCPDAKNAHVPCLIQDIFPGYSGVAWYWRDVVIPVNPNEAGRYLLRFREVDYVADIWVNGTHLGTHE